MSKQKFAFDKTNFILLAVGMAVVILGFILMTGPGKEIELVPRVGDHIVYLGKLEHFEDKLDRLKTFYGKALNEVGWNKYSRISLEFSNQIICTKHQ